MNKKNSPAILIMTICLLTWCNVIAQNDSIKTQTKKYNNVYTFAFEQGPMMGNGDAIGDQLVNSTYYNGINLRFGQRKTNYNDIYNNIYRFPEMGFGAYLSTFHESAIGNPLALYYFFKIPLGYEKSNRINFSYLCGLGIASNFNPYHEFKNPTDVFIGSITNAYINFKLQASYNFSPHWSATAGFGFKHFSNGSMQQPNKGINLIPVTIAVNYRPTEYKPYEGKTVLPSFIKYNTLNIAYIAGSQNFEAGMPNHFKSALSINALRAINYKYRLGIGMDVFYTSGAAQLANTTASFSNSVSFAAVGSWEWVLNKNLYIPLAVGIYLNRNPATGETKFFYERAGIRYRFDNNIFCGVSVKAHLGAAEFIEWTVGYSLFKDPNKY